MGLCKDPRLTYLNDKGYNVVLLPRTGIEPLDIVGSDGKSKERLGTLSQIWHSTTPVPVQNPPAPAVNINGTKTDDFKLSLGLDLLSNILKGMGAQSPKVDVGYTRARKVQFSFANVFSISVDPFAVGNYLAAGDLVQHNPFVERYFDDEGTSAYVITEVLKSNSITVSAKDDHGASVAVDLPQIQQVVGVNVQVTANASSTSDLTYTGNAQLSFGFKSFGIEHQSGQWSVYGVQPSGSTAFSLSSAPQPIVFSPGRMIVLREKAVAAA